MHKQELQLIPPWIEIADKSNHDDGRTNPGYITMDTMTRMMNVLEFTSVAIELGADPALSPESEEILEAFAQIQALDDMMKTKEMKLEEDIATTTISNMITMIRTVSFDAFWIWWCDEAIQVFRNKRKHQSK
jgi:hypothetical protein